MANGPTYEVTNGRWFTGTEFQVATRYVAGRLLHSTAPGPVDATIDLQGQYVVPPYAEGHNHWLEPAGVDAYLQSYLRDGVFYLKDQTNAPVVRAALDAALNTPTSVDFICANQGFTGPGGHPLQIAAQFLKFGALPGGWTEADIPGNVVNVVENSADVERTWPGFLSGRPDFVKVFLLYSEEYSRRLKDPSFIYKTGLDPELVPDIVRRAHAAGLRVSAHVYSATDFHNALLGGVDDIAHMPGTGHDPTLEDDAFRIAPADVRLAAERSATVTTTLYWLNEREPSDRARIVEAIIRPNLELLRRNGVAILLGSDEFRATPAHEADVVASLGVFSNLELLDLWTRATPQAIFPDRKIGRLADGYEASFLVLADDPGTDFANTHRISMRMKEGHVLANPRSVPFPELDG